MISLLERHGATVYVDKKDEALPKVTSRETATILRERIRHCRKFVLLTPQTARTAGGCPGSSDCRTGSRTQRTRPSCQAPIRLMTDSGPNRNTSGSTTGSYTVPINRIVPRLHGLESGEQHGDRVVVLAGILGLGHNPIATSLQRLHAGLPSHSRPVGARVRGRRPDRGADLRPFRWHRHGARRGRPPHSV